MTKFKQLNLFEDIAVLDTMIHREDTEKQPPVLFIPAHQGYIEIMGHKIKGISSFEDFINYIKQLDGIRVENENLKARVEKLNERELELLAYLEKRIDETKIMRTYDPTTRKEELSISETVYREIRDRIILNK